MKVLLVDDEPLALRRLEIILKNHEDVEIVGAHLNPVEALRAIPASNPDIVILDISMPEMDGFALLEQIPSPHTPQIIFVTAFDHFAVQAFRSNAADYLLKPIEEPLLFEALDRAIKRIEIIDAHERHRELQEVIANLRSALADRVRSENSKQIWIKENGRMVKLQQDHIFWIEAERDYVRIHLQDRSYLKRQTMTSLQSSMDEDAFLRVHRSAMVNLEHVRQKRFTATGGHMLRLNNGAEVKVGRSYQRAVKAALK